MYKVRNYSPNDYQMIKTWWDHAKEAAPGPELLPIESTLVMEINDVPSLCITVYLTNCKEICFFEGFISNPDIKKELRKDATQTMIDAACLFASKMGYKKAVTLAYKDKVKQRCVDWGFTKTLDSLSSFAKVVG